MCLIYRQVHLARLGGKQVVVKVQRPGLRQLFDIDLKNIRVLAQWLQAVDPNSDGAARDWVAIYDECSRILYQVCFLNVSIVYVLHPLVLLLVSRASRGREAFILTSAKHCSLRRCMRKGSQCLPLLHRALSSAH